MIWKSNANRTIRTGKGVRDLMDKNINSCADISEAYYMALHPEEFESAVSKSKGVVGMRLFPNGAWVKLTLEDYQHTIGYITGYSYLTGNYFVKITIIKGMPVNPKSNYTEFTQDCLSPVDDLDVAGFDNSFLVDLALATRDEEWFDQLMNGGK
jgi:hypothetical protein